MSTIYPGSTHVFTSRSENGTITLKAGQGEVLNLASTVIPPMAFYDTQPNISLGTTSTVAVTTSVAAKVGDDLTSGGSRLFVTTEDSYTANPSGSRFLGSTIEFDSSFTQGVAYKYFGNSPCTYSKIMDTVTYDSINNKLYAGNAQLTNGSRDTDFAVLSTPSNTTTTVVAPLNGGLPCVNGFDCYNSNLIGNTIDASGANLYSFGHGTGNVTYTVASTGCVCCCMSSKYLFIGRNISSVGSILVRYYDPVSDSVTHRNLCTIELPFVPCRVECSESIIVACGSSGGIAVISATNFSVLMTGNSGASTTVRRISIISDMVLIVHGLNKDTYTDNRLSQQVYLLKDSSGYWYIATTQGTQTTSAGTLFQGKAVFSNASGNNSPLTLQSYSTTTGSQILKHGVTVDANGINIFNKISLTSTVDPTLFGDGMSCSYITSPTFTTNTAVISYFSGTLAVPTISMTSPSVSTIDVNSLTCTTLNNPSYNGTTLVVSTSAIVTSLTANSGVNSVTATTASTSTTTGAIKIGGNLVVSGTISGTQEILKIDCGAGSAISTSGTVDLTWSGASVTNSGSFTYSAGVVTIGETGLYIFNANYTCNTSTNIVSLLVNGTTSYFFNTANGNNNGVLVVPMTAADTVNVRVVSPADIITQNFWYVSKIGV